MNKLIENRDLANHCLNYLIDKQYFTLSFLFKGKIHINSSLINLRSLAIASKGWRNLISEYCKNKYPGIPLSARTIQYRNQLIELALSHSIIIASIKNSDNYAFFFSLMEGLKIEQYIDLSYIIRRRGFNLFPYFILSNNIRLHSILNLEDVNRNQLLALHDTLCCLQKKEHLSFSPLLENLEFLEKLLSSPQKGRLLNNLDCWTPYLGLKGG